LRALHFLALLKLNVWLFDGNVLSCYCFVDLSALFIVRGLLCNAPALCLVK